MPIPFDRLNEALTHHAESLVQEIIPGGKVTGREYKCGSLLGGEGDSLSFNLDKCMGSDFATGETFGDLIDLASQAMGVGIGEAARYLAQRIGFDLGDGPPPKAIPPETRTVVTDTPPTPAIAYDLMPPPKDAPPPPFGNPTGKWEYKDQEGNTLFWIARYEPNDTGRKVFRPWSWDRIKGEWIAKSWPAPRPLYGLADLASQHEKPVLVVEGEKSCDAAREICGNVYVCVTWPGGSSSIKRSDLSPLAGRKILIWPDADEAGLSAQGDIIDAVKEIADEIKIVVVDDAPNGWDLADALAVDNWDWKKMREWAKSRIQVIKASTSKAAPPPPPVIAEKVSSIETSKTIIDNRKVEITVVEDNEWATDLIPVNVSGTWEELGICLNSRGIPFNNVETAHCILRGHAIFQSRLWYDDFHRKIFTDWSINGAKGRVHEITDDDVLQMHHWIVRHFEIRNLSLDSVHNAIRVYSQEHRRNEPREWMDGLEWDGTPRIETYLRDYLGSEDTTYTRAASGNWWKGIAARVWKPGCQLDSMIVLIGPQGCGKTSSMKAVGGDWHTEASASIMDKDFFMSLQGKLIVEISEMDAFSKAEKTTVKRVVSTATDRFRAPYARLPQDHPRQCVFAGTTNAQRFLSDETGGRRFWPVEVADVKIDDIMRDRKQLFAEAVAKFKEGESWHLMPIADTVAVQEKHRNDDAWEAPIQRWLINREEPEATLVDVARGALQIETGRLDLNSQRRIAAILTMNGWRQKTENGSARGRRPIRLWVRSPSPVSAQSSTYTTYKPDTQQEESHEPDAKSDRTSDTADAQSSHPEPAEF